MSDKEVTLDPANVCRSISATDVRRHTPWPELVNALARTYADLPVLPPRERLSVDVPGGTPGSLLTMPAYRPDGLLGVKLVTVFPGNRAVDAPAVSGVYVLFCARTGRLLATIDSGELTARRTAAASALASTFLSRRDSDTLLMLGAGHIAPSMIAAHCSVRPIKRVLIWTRTAEKSEAFAETMRLPGIAFETVPSVSAGLRHADIVCAATLATEPLIRGVEVLPGTHVDLVGAFTPEMRESDDELIRKGQVYADVRDAVLAEAGDLLQPIAAAAFHPRSVIGDLHDLTCGIAPGRSSPDEITVFKSVGVAAADLAAAELIWSSCSRVDDRAHGEKVAEIAQGLEHA